MQQTPFLRVYTAELPPITDEILYPIARQEEIAALSNQKVKREKIGVWRLLRYAVEDTFQRPFTQFVFEKRPNGKWTCDDFFFSLSHSKNALAVALSSHPVGVDIQQNGHTMDEFIAKKILNPEEKERYETLSEPQKRNYLFIVWTKKEAQFKGQNAPESTNVFSPARIYIEENQTTAQLLAIANEGYTLAVCSPIIKNLQQFDEIPL